MTLSYTLGQRIAGRVCRSDEAFYELHWEVTRLAQRATWAWFIDRVDTLESALSEAGGFDTEQANAWESGQVCDGIDKYLKTVEICCDLEDFVAAFFLTLQTRLTAVIAAARRTYDLARTDDDVEISTPKKHELLPGELKSVWEIANYVKHKDEWPQAVSEMGADAKPRRTLECLVQLGVATESEGKPEFVRWLLQESVHKVTGERSLSVALGSIVRDCERGAQEIEERVQRDFLPLSRDLDAVRARNMPTKRTKSAQAKPQDG